MSVPYPDRRVRKTKETLHASLLSLMQEKSFRQISITEIVRRADCTRGTFYLHYERKEELLDEMIREMFEKMREAYRQPYKDLQVIDLEELPGSSIVLFDHFLEHRTFYKIMLDPKTDYGFREKMHRWMDRLFREDFGFIIKEHDEDLDTKMFSTYRINGIIGLVLEWIDNDFDHPASYMDNQLIRILKFSTPKFYVRGR